MPKNHPIGVVIADTSFIVRKGLKSLIEETTQLEFIAEAVNVEDLVKIIIATNPNVLIVDHCCDDCFSIEIISKIKTDFPLLNVLVIAHEVNPIEIKKILNIGVKNFLLKDCSEREMLDAIIACSKGEKFFCQQIIDVLLDSQVSKPYETKGITEREHEIITLLVKGNRPKEIADQLSISPLTVNTHKKNIYRKLGINHSFELAQYALKIGVLK